MAPEVELGEKYEKSADVFSFGMVVWELITREKPLNRNTAGVMTLLSWQPALWRDKLKGFSAESVPPGLWKLFEECCQKDSQSRPDFNHIYKTLDKLLDELGGEDAVREAIAAPKGDSKADEKKKKRRRR